MKHLIGIALTLASACAADVAGVDTGLTAQALETRLYLVVNSGEQGPFCPLTAQGDCVAATSRGVQLTRQLRTFVRMD